METTYGRINDKRNVNGLPHEHCMFKVHDFEITQAEYRSSTYFTRTFNISKFELILFPIIWTHNTCTTKQGGSVLTHETRIREVRVQIPWPANLAEVFSGFLNLKINKELVIFKDKCRVGPHIPLQMY